MTIQSKQSSKISPEQEDKLRVAVETASQKWMDAVNAGSAEGAASVYEDDAYMEVKPFGVYKGKAEIQKFWADIVSKGMKDVEYYNTTLSVIDATAAVISSDWKMNVAKGNITKELWVLQPDGSALLREDYFEATEYPGSE